MHSIDPSPSSPGARSRRAHEGLIVRSLRLDDEPALRAAFDALSPATRYQRFLCHVSALSDWMFRYLCDVDATDHVAIGAFAPADGQLVGVARFIRSTREPTLAELAVTVVDAWQGRGVGTMLVHALARVADQAGVKQLTAHTFATNRSIVQVMRNVGDVRTLPLGPECLHLLTLRTSQRDEGAVATKRAVLPR